MRIIESGARRRRPRVPEEPPDEPPTTPYDPRRPHDEVLIYVKFVQKALFQGRLGVTLAIQFSIDMTLVQQIKSLNDIYSFNQVHAFFHCFLRNCEKYLTRLKFVKKL